MSLFKTLLSGKGTADYSHINSAGDYENPSYTSDNDFRRWEYMTFDTPIVHDRNESIGYLNTLGDEGWELTSTSINEIGGQVVYVLKRPANHHQHDDYDR